MVGIAAIWWHTANIFGAVLATIVTNGTLGEKTPGCVIALATRSPRGHRQAIELELPQSSTKRGAVDPKLPSDTVAIAAVYLHRVYDRLPLEGLERRAGRGAGQSLPARPRRRARVAKAARNIQVEIADVNRGTPRPHEREANHAAKLADEPTIREPSKTSWIS